MPENVKFTQVEGILEIGKRGLCHQCGACVGLCPSNTLALDAECKPIQVNACSQCSLCTNICSGAEVDYQRIGRWLFGESYRYDGALGSYRSAQVGHARDKTVRWRGTSGGVVTQLLIHLLQSGRIQGAIVAGPHPDDPSVAKGFVASTAKDLLRSSQSKYTTTPMLDSLHDIPKAKGTYAVVALPCQVHVIRKLQMAHKAWKRRISLVIGLYCHYRLPHEATRETAAIMAPKGERLTSIRYRQKDTQGWPHNTMEMEFTDGSKWRSPYGCSQTVSLLAHCYPLRRCLLCIDALADFSDLSVGDPWIRNRAGEWKYSSPGGWSAIIVRTAVGENVLKDAQKKGAMVLRPIPPQEITDGQHMMIGEKFYRTPVRMAIRHFFNFAVPSYGLDYPPPRIPKIFKELLFFSLRIITVYQPVRKFFVRLGFSRTGQRFMGWRRKFNQRRAVKRLNRSKSS